MPRFWQSVDVAVAPSGTIIESFGMAALEAMACGLPVIVTRNGGLADLVADGVTGSIVEPCDVAGLELALAEYADEETIATRGASARQVAVERFSLDACLEAYLRFRAADGNGR